MFDGKTIPNTWIVVYTHRFGTDTWLVEHDRMPTEAEIVAGLSDWEGDTREDEWVEVTPARVYPLNLT